MTRPLDPEAKMLRMIQRRLLFLGVPLLLLLAAACTAESTPAPTAIPPSPTPLPLPAPMTGVSVSSMGMSSASGKVELTGASLYQLSCAACHGVDRAGSTLSKDGQSIDVPPLAWDDLNSMYSSNPSRGSVPDQLALAITKGQDEDGNDMSTVMPRWSSLSQAQVSSLIAFIQSAAPSAGAAPTLDSAATGLMGEPLYQQACAACHGADRAGSTLEQDGQKIKVPTLAWGDLSQMYSSNPARGDVPTQLGLAITKGQDEDGNDMSTVMPRWTFLSNEQVSSLAQFLQNSATGMMPGSGTGTMPTSMMGGGAAGLDGGSLFQLACAACHGQDRGGNKFTVDGQTIDVPALGWDDLNGMYSEKPERGTVEQQLALAITKGEDETGDPMNEMMPRWAGLGDAQVASLVQYIQAGDPSGSGMMSTAAQNLTGQQLYATACAACHGLDGAGKTFEMDGNKIETPTLSWKELSDMYSANPARGTVEQQVGLAITKGQNEDGEDLAAMMPRWSSLTQAQVDSLGQYFQGTFK